MWDLEVFDREMGSSVTLISEAFGDVLPILLCAFGKKEIAGCLKISLLLVILFRPLFSIQSLGSA